MKPRIAVSFSGGRSSAVMAKRCLDLYGETHELSFCFANTGSEHEDTLRFAHAVDTHFLGGRLVWIEAEFHRRGIGPTAKIVTYETAARNHEPFEEAVKKHGVFCKTHPQCTSRLKEEPMASYRRSIGWAHRTYDTAIGIRADEFDRCSSKAREKRLIYPLVQEGWTSDMVRSFMAQFDWDLRLPSAAFGNCVWCWKKSLRKLLTVASVEPERFDFPARMEVEHGRLDIAGTGKAEGRVFFRENRSTQDILRLAQTETFIPFTDSEVPPWDNDMDMGGGCGDSCEIGADE
jgi:hypothetical protein